MKKKLIVRYIFLLLSLAVMGLEFYFSSQDGSQSSQVSGRWSDTVQTVFNYLHIPSAGSFFITNIRKFAHAFIYACMGLCVSVCAFTFDFKHKWLWIVIPLAICFVYACGDEFHQSFVAGRDGKFADVLVDAIGFCISIAVVNIVCFLICRRKNNCEKERLKNK